MFRDAWAYEMSSGLYFTVCFLFTRGGKRAFLNTYLIANSYYVTILRKDFELDH